MAVAATAVVLGDLMVAATAALGDCLDTANDAALLPAATLDVPQPCDAYADRCIYGRACLFTNRRRNVAG